MKKFHHIILGGTFDHFHRGHRSLLKKALELGEKITIGITTDKFCQKKFLAQSIEPFAIRKKAVEKFVKKYLGDSRQLDILPIFDIYGTTLIDKTIEAIVVSQATKKNALLINEKRKVIGFPKLAIVVVDNVLAEDGKLLSSERIRAGEVDREGNNYLLSIIRNHKEKLILPEFLRQELRKPLGQVILAEENQLEETAKKALHYFKIMKSVMVISVGDVITSSLLKIGFDPDVKIIDFRVRRKDVASIWSMSHFATAVTECDIGRYANQPGTINLKTTSLLKSKIKKFLLTGKKSWLLIKGEEDLLVLPSILLAPLGSVVIYGQMDLGVVLVLVTEEKKREVVKLLREFT
jgi:pantetheine-phosphate adenylyltransferase